MQSLGLVGYWSFDVGKGTAKAVDMSGRGNNGTLTNMNTTAAWVGGKIGNALNFDGSDDYVNGSSAFNFTSQDFTIAHWIKLDSLSTNNPGQGPVPIFKGQYQSSGYYSQIGETTGAIVFVTNQGGANQTTLTANGEITTGVWYHITYARSGSNVRIYVNGADKTVTFGTHSNPTSSSENFQVGSYNVNNNIFTNGLIDEVRVYNRALSADEIKRLYRQTSPQFNASQANKLRQGLVGMWTFDGNDMSGNTALDRSGNNNTGTLTNGPKKVIGKIGQALSLSATSCVIVSQSSSLNTLSQFSASLWAKPSINGVNFLHKGDPGAPSPGWQFYLSDVNNRLGFRQSLSAGAIDLLAGNGVTTFGEWQYFTVVVDGSGTDAGVYIYRNGVELSHTNHFGSGSGNASDDSVYGLKIGSDEYSDCAGTGNRMSMDEVRVYNRALTPAEIRQLYKAGSSFHPNVTNKSTIRDGLVGHWSFDGADMGTTSARDASGSGNTGWLINGTKKVIGQIAQGLSFDGSNDYVKVPDSGTILDFSSTGTYTWSAWLKYSSFPASQQCFISKDVCTLKNGFNLCLNQTGSTADVVVCKYTGASCTWTCSSGLSLGLSPNTWMHVVVTYNGSSGWGTYINGVYQGDQTFSIVSDTSSFYSIGSGNGGGVTQLPAKFFNGSIDEVRVYNRALSPAEIKRLYNMGR